MDRASFYRQHLLRVSRSFSFCIGELSPELASQVALAYILCRLVDTVEDSRWPTHDGQQAAFLQFARMIEHEPKPEDVMTWQKSLPANLPEGERILVQDSARFFSDLHALPQPVRQPIQRTVLTMTEAMRQFCRQSKTVGGLEVKGRLELNKYCLFVAGIVGELLTELFHVSDPGVEVDRASLRRAVEFGFYLQKINILKDQRDDETAGRAFVYSREHILGDLLGHAEAALDYILRLPQTRSDIRLFCAWSYFIGLAALESLQQSWRSGRPLKVPRAKTLILVERVRDLIASNEGLQKLSGRMMTAIARPANVGLRPFDSVDSGFSTSEIYRGQLSLADLAELHLLSPNQ